MRVPLTMALIRLGGASVQWRLGATRTLAIGAVSAGAGFVVAAVVPVSGFAGFEPAGA